MTLSGKTVVVTGVGSNLGRILCERFAMAGATVCGTSRSKEKLVAVAERVRTLGGSEPILECGDATDPVFLKDFLGKVTAYASPIYGLINNIGPVATGDWDSLEPDDILNSCRANIFPLYFGVKYLQSAIKQAGGGCILQIGSVSAFQAGSISKPDHGMFKIASLNLINKLSQTLAKNNIRANMVSPGFIDDPEEATGFEASLTERMGLQSQEEAIKTYTQSNIPLGRPATSEDVAQLCLFLFSRHAQYITGQNILVDGGYTKGISV